MKKDRIKNKRKELNLSQTALGNLIGVTKASISQWETGNPSLRGDNLLKLAKVFGVTPDWIETGKPMAGMRSDDAPVYDISKLQHEVMLLDRINLTKKLQGKDFDVLQALDASTFNGNRSINSFALVEDRSGMAPFINKGDWVLIDPSASIADDFFSLFWANDEPMIGIASESPQGMFLRFISKDPGWAPIKVSRDNYIGRVVDIDPEWIRKQRDSK